MHTNLKRVFNFRNIIVLLILMGVVVLAGIVIYDSTHYSIKELQEIEEEIIEGYMGKDGVCGVGIDYENMVVDVTVRSSSENKEEIIEELTKKYGKAISIVIGEWSHI